MGVSLLKCLMCFLYSQRKEYYQSLRACACFSNRFL